MGIRTAPDDEGRALAETRAICNEPKERGPNDPEYGDI